MTEPQDPVIMAAHAADMSVLQYYRRVVMPARAEALVKRLRPEDERRPFGRLEYQWTGREPTGSAEGKARYEAP